MKSNTFGLVGNDYYVVKVVKLNWVVRSHISPGSLSDQIKVRHEGKGLSMVLFPCRL